MIITGIESDLYYINNPILLKITNLDPLLNFLELSVTNLNDPTDTITSNVLRVYPNLNNEIIDFPLDEVIKANFTRPTHPTATLSNGSPIETNYIRFRISIQQILTNGNSGASFIKNYTFLRGGKESQGSNITASVGDVLKETDKLLVWGGLPFAKYYIDSDKKIAVTKVIPSDEIQQMKQIGCNPFYVRFLNSKGGYSFWYFPVWEQEKKTKSSGHVDNYRPKNGFSLGFETTHTVKAESKIRREYFALAEALISSPEVYVYNKYGNTWSRIELKEGSFSRNTYEDVTDFNVQFNVKLSNDERLVW